MSTARPHRMRGMNTFCGSYIMIATPFYASFLDEIRGRHPLAKVKPAAWDKCMTPIEFLPVFWGTEKAILNRDAVPARALFRSQLENLDYHPHGYPTFLCVVHQGFGSSHSELSAEE